MNLIKRKFLKYKDSGLIIKHEGNTLHIINESDKHAFLFLPTIFRGKVGKNATMKLYGKILKGNGAVFQALDLKRNILSETSFNSCSDFSVQNKSFICSIKVLGKSEIIIKELSIDFNVDISEKYTNIINSNNDVLIITPSYPTEENKYFGGFVHSRVKAYKENGIKFDLVCAHKYTNSCEYNFEGIDVTRTNFNGLRHILTQKKYKTILLHFFDDDYAKILDACDLSETNLYFWIHGPETLYWDWSKMTDNYFRPQRQLTMEQINKFNYNDELIKRYNNYGNVHWVFVSNWIKKRSEELINIHFNNSIVIPNFIDENNFNYIEKNAEQRKKIFFIRRFDNINKYAIDINVRTILELSRRKCFKDLEFNIYGTGELHSELTAPIKNFKNVHLYQKFLTHEEIANIHKKNGIGLFATRYDAQGVSMCEAASSGLAIVSSTNDAIAEFIPNVDNNLCDTEDYIKYADIIEKMYYDEKLFKEISRQCHNSIYEKCRFSETIAKEIECINNIGEYKSNFAFEKSGTNKILSIIIPSYNVEKYLYHCGYTIMEHKNCNKIELIIVNDGSKDGTLNVAKKLQNRYSSDNVIIVDKPNGGHGSTINKGIEIATGKYIRIIDGDDWVNTEKMCELVDKLEEENADIVLTDYCEDRAEPNELIFKTIYEFMIPFKKYNFDDLCYEGYGFKEWGPILATASFKTNMLKNSFKLSEKCFYIDMEFDVYSIAKAKTVVYYPYSIYRYFIGRVDQSISKKSYIKNYKNHEQVLFNVMKFYTEDEKLSKEKKQYILNKVIIPLVIANYTIIIGFKKSSKDFREFEKKFKNYPEIYNNPKVATRMKKFHRKTNGVFVKFDVPLKRIKEKLF